MDEITKLTLLTFAVGILTLIITIMTIQKGRLILLFQIILTLVTCYGLLKFHYWWIGQELHIWSLEEYNPESLIMFYNEMLSKCFWYCVISAILFYVLLRIVIVKILYNKIKNIYLKLFQTNDKAIPIMAKWFERASSARKIFKPKEEQIQYDRSKDKEFESDLIDVHNNTVTSIHFIVCLIILDIPYKLIWYPIFLFLLLILIFGRPIMRAIIDHQFPENPPTTTP